MLNPVELLRLLNNLLRIGTIAEVRHADGRARFADGNLLTDWRPWLHIRAGTTRDWDPPTVGEQCLLLSPGGELTNGIILLGLNRSAHAAPSDDPGECLRIYPDGAVISYNHETHHLQATLPGTATVDAQGNVSLASGGNVSVQAAGNLTAEVDGIASVTAGSSITLTSPDNVIEGPLTVNGNTTINGTLNVSGLITGGADIIASGTSLKLHLTTGVTPGSGTSGPPA